MFGWREGEWRGEGDLGGEGWRGEGDPGGEGWRGKGDPGGEGEMVQKRGEE